MTGPLASTSGSDSASASPAKIRAKLPRSPQVLHSPLDPAAARGDEQEEPGKLDRPTSFEMTSSSDTESDATGGRAQPDGRKLLGIGQDSGDEEATIGIGRPAPSSNGAANGYPRRTAAARRSSKGKIKTRRLGGLGGDSRPNASSSSSGDEGAKGSWVRNKAIKTEAGQSPPIGKTFGANGGRSSDDSGDERRQRAAKEDDGQVVMIRRQSSSSSQDDSPPHHPRVVPLLPYHPAITEFNPDNPMASIFSIHNGGRNFTLDHPSGHHHHHHHHPSHPHPLAVRFQAGPDGLDQAPPQDFDRKWIRVRPSKEAEERNEREQVEEEKRAKAREKKAVKLREKRLARKAEADEAAARTSSAATVKPAPSVDSPTASPAASVRPSSALATARPPSSFGAASDAPPPSSSSATAAPAEPWQIPRAGRFWGHDDRAGPQSESGSTVASGSGTGGGRGRGRGGGLARGGAPSSAGRGGGSGGRGGALKGSSMRADWEERRQGARERPETRFAEHEAAPKPSPSASLSSPVVSAPALAPTSSSSTNLAASGARPDTPAGRSEKSSGSGGQGWTTVQAKRGGGAVGGAKGARGWPGEADAGEWRHDGWEEMERENEVRGAPRGRGRGGMRGAAPGRASSQQRAQQEPTLAPIESSAASSTTTRVTTPQPPPPVPSSSASTTSSKPPSTAEPAWTTKQPVPYLFNGPGSRQYTDRSSGKPVIETTVALGSGRESPKKGVRIELAKDGEDKGVTKEARSEAVEAKPAPPVTATPAPAEAPVRSASSTGAVVKLPSTIQAPATLRAQPATPRLVNGDPSATSPLPEGVAPISKSGTPSIQPNVPITVPRPKPAAVRPAPPAPIAEASAPAEQQVIYTADPSNLPEPAEEPAATAKASPGSLAGAAVLREALNSPASTPCSMHLVDPAPPPAQTPQFPPPPPPPQVSYPQNGPPYYPPPIPYIDPVSGQPVPYPPPPPPSYGYGMPPPPGTGASQQGIYQPSPHQGYYDVFNGPAPPPQTPPSATPGLYVPARSTKVRISRPASGTRVASGGPGPGPNASVGGSGSSGATSPVVPRRKMSFGSSFRSGGTTSPAAPSPHLQHPYRSSSGSYSSGVGGAGGPLEPPVPVPTGSPAPSGPYYEHNGMTFYQPPPPMGMPPMYYPAPPSHPNGFVNAYPPFQQPQQGEEGGEGARGRGPPPRLDDPSIVQQGQAFYGAAGQPQWEGGYGPPHPGPEYAEL